MDHNACPGRWCMLHHLVSDDTSQNQERNHVKMERNNRGTEAKLMEHGNCKGYRIIYIHEIKRTNRSYNRETHRAAATVVTWIIPLITEHSIPSVTGKAGRTICVYYYTNHRRKNLSSLQDGLTRCRNSIRSSCVLCRVNTWCMTFISNVDRV